MKKLKSTMIAVALLATIVFSSIPIEAGIIIRGRGDDGDSFTPPPVCQDQDEDRGGIIIRGLTGLIILGLTGIVITGLAEEDPEELCK